MFGGGEVFSRNELMAIEFEARPIIIFIAGGEALISVNLNARKLGPWHQAQRTS